MYDRKPAKIYWYSIPLNPHCMLVERHAYKEHWEIQGLLLQRLALFQAIEDQNERDQIASDRMQKNCKCMKLIKKTWTHGYTPPPQ